MTVEVEDGGATDARIVVNDTGAGIPPERLNDIFEPFVRLESEHSGVEGTGIGLALTEQLVTGMQGQIGVESTPGVGSSFWISLPGAAASGYPLRTLDA